MEHGHEVLLMKRTACLNIRLAREKKLNKVTQKTLFILNALVV